MSRRCKKQQCLFTWIMVTYLYVTDGNKFTRIQQKSIFFSVSISIHPVRRKSPKDYMHTPILGNTPLSVATAVRTFHSESIQFATGPTVVQTRCPKNQGNAAVFSWALVDWSSVVAVDFHLLGRFWNSSLFEFSLVCCFQWLLSWLLSTRAKKLNVRLALNVDRRVLFSIAQYI